MIALWIILGLIGLIWLLLAMPLRLFLSYQQDTLNYKIKYGPISLIDSSAPPKERKKKTEQAASAPTGKKVSGGAAAKLLDFLGLSEISSITNFKNAISKSGIVGTLSAVFSAVKQLFSRIGKLIQKGIFKKFDLTIVIADEDAAEAALRFGQVCAVAFPMLQFLENKMKLRKENVDIRCDYESDHMQVSFDGQLNYRPWHFVCFLMGLVMNYIKRSVKKEK